MAGVGEVGTVGALGLPLCTVGVVGLCCAVQLGEFLFAWPTEGLALVAAPVVYAHEYWRVFTAAFTHGGVVHLLMNMSSMVAIGGSLERQVGSLQLAFAVVWQTVVTGTVHVVLSWVLAVAVLGDLSYLQQPSVGFSGVLFALVVLDTRRSSPDATRPLFGFFPVPMRAYPWLMLLVLQVTIPRVSFLGHLSGILAGTAQAHGALAWALPSVTLTRAVEAWPPFAPVVRHRLFVACPDTFGAFGGGIGSEGGSDHGQSVCSDLCTAVWTARVYVEVFWTSVRDLTRQGTSTARTSAREAPRPAQGPTVFV